MPFKSASQMRGAFSGALGPDMKAAAPEWAASTPSPSKLPDHVAPRRKKMSKRDTFISHLVHKS